CGSNDACLCETGVVGSVLSCQQCFFASLIEQNRRIPNLLAGSAPALTQYGNSCAHLTPPAMVQASLLTLTLPSNWDGPAALPLNTGETVVYFVAVLTLGIGLIGVILTM
ncbi:hypothetical protein K488DRAFT_53586, partial [Vararia minispora EC-137]